MPSGMTVWLALGEMHFHNCRPSSSHWAGGIMLIIMLTTIGGLSVRSDKLFWFGVRQMPLEHLKAGAQESQNAEQPQPFEHQSIEFALPNQASDLSGSTLTLSTARPSSTDFMCNVFYSEWYWIGWLTTLVCFWIPGVLVSLARSMSPSGMLWLRLSPVEPWKVMAARLLSSISIACLLLLVELAWIVMAATWHGFRPQLVLISVAMGFVYRVFTIQILCVVASVARDESSTFVLTLTSATMPVWLFVSGLGVTSNFEGALGQIWPFVMPFRYLNDDALVHTFALLVLGTCFMAIAGTRVILSPIHTGVSNA